MSAAISNQWWAAKGLLTEQAKDLRESKKRNTDMQTYTYSYRHPGINRMGLSSGRWVAAERRRTGRGGSCCLHLSAQRGLDPAG